MELNSPDKSIEESKEDDGASNGEKLDLNLSDRKCGQGEESFGLVNGAMNSIMQVVSNQDQCGSPLLPVGVNNEGLQCSSIKSNSPGSSSPSTITEPYLPIQSAFHCDDVDRKISFFQTEGLRSPLADNHGHNKREETQYVGLSDELLDSSANETFNKVENEDLNTCTHNPLLKIEDKNAHEVVDSEAVNCQSAKSPTSHEPVIRDSGNTSRNTHTQSEKAEFGTEEIEGENCNQHIETKQDYCLSVMVPSENGGIEWENSHLCSPPKTRNATPSLEKRLSVSPKRSPQTQPSASQGRPHPGNSGLKAYPSPSSSKRKRSLSPEKHNVGRKRASSCDRLSPSLRRKSPSDRTTQRDSHHKDNSPRKRSSALPQRRESPRKRDRSASRSPVRRNSSGYRRDRRGRSRSRSPYSRDRYQRSPRRRQTLRRRSPPSGYHSRRRSPRRPWSPPANRNTGVGRPGNNLFVAGFSYATTERDLEKKFSRFGRVTDVRVVQDKSTGDSRGFGFVSVEKDEDADAAIRALDQTEWNGRIILVEKSKTSLR